MDETEKEAEKDIEKTHECPNRCSEKSESEQDVRQGIGNVKLSDGSFYQGECLYEGEWTGGVPNGFGKQVFPNRSCYEGEFKDGLKHGTGKLLLRDGSSYEGGWKNEIRHGIGKDLTSDGSPHHREWRSGESPLFAVPQGCVTYRHCEEERKDDDKHGIGKDLNPGGSSYEGELKDGIPHGSGAYLYPDGSSYVGEWKDAKRHGAGKYLYPSGSYYEGEWKDNVKHGNGKNFFLDRSIYEGEFKDDAMHGIGKHLYPDKSSYEGEWKKRSDDPSFYEGKWIDDVRDGIGKYIYRTGSSYEGEWKDGFKHGTGKCVFSDGSSYEGEWKDDVTNGIGKYLKPDGTPCNGEWKNFVQSVSWNYNYPDGFFNEGEYPDYHYKSSSDTDHDCKTSGRFGVELGLWMFKAFLTNPRNADRELPSPVTLIVFSGRFEVVKDSLSNIVKLNHTNLMKFYDMGRLINPKINEVYDCIVMESCNGENQTLSQFIKDNQLNIMQILDITAQLLDALVYLHSRQPTIIVGNLRSSAIIVTPDGNTVKIWDLSYGVGRQTEELQKMKWQALESVKFLHPDMMKSILESKPAITLTHNFDIWSLGCIILDMWTRGKIRHVNKDGILLGLNISIQGFMDSIFNDGKPQLSPSVPPEIKEISASCFRRKSELQYSAEQLLDFLRYEQSMAVIEDTEQERNSYLGRKPERQYTTAQLRNFNQMKKSIPNTEKSMQLPIGCFYGFDNKSCLFQYKSILGNGSSGMVYSMFVSENKIPEITEHETTILALKILHRQPLDNTQQKDLLCFDNPNVIKYICFGELLSTPDGIKLPQPRLSIIMEYCEGKTLNSLAKEQPLKESDVISFTRQLVNGIKYLHEQDPPFIHGDLKGENVLVSDDKKLLKIIDLDSCIQMEGKVTHRSDVKGQVGTLYHMSPEMLQFDPSDPPVGRATDIWSLGCTVLEMFGGGDVPYVDCNGKALLTNLNMKDFTELVKADSNPDISKLTSRNLTMSNYFAEVIKSCLHKDPSKRPSASKLLEQLKQC